ncbi:hypothetical protein PLESTB_001610000 [Pleodorina starrii]|uniref:Cytochrome P450 n=1 Tax=Pleodorina starrii TaxID=330485 RepID=A0A9W6F8J5_9CHLO|nr:hypothetical protein PLESTM_000170600 [Pleodorina starrii]GLC60417.1 hypothetical protein PLESTB_001610000 [Pleodorina starrii]GLC64146.1 hypothetical protein PLESTF_000129400 [Pleodorina starrii]
MSCIRDILAQQPALWYTVVVGAVLVATAVQLVLWACNDKNDAATVPGLPVIGNALALGRHGVSYISECRRKFGDSFSLSLAGVKMTFLFEPAHIPYFFAAPDDKITFRPAVEQFTQRVFGLTSKIFFPLHFKMLTELRHLLVPGALAEQMQSLGTRALQLLPCYVHHAQVDLWSLCRGLVFHCAVEAVFGRAFVDELAALTRCGSGAEGEREREHGGEGLGEAWAEQQQQQPQASCAPNALWEALDGAHRMPPPRPPVGVERLSRTFFTFEEGFELAASPLPHAFQTAFVEARAELLRVLGAADRKGLFRGTTAGDLLDRTTGLPAHLRPNLLLALLWASQANLVPSVFWSTAFLLLPENAVHKASIVAELQMELQTASAQPSGPAAAATEGAAGANGLASRPADSPTARLQTQPSTSEVVAAATRLAANRRSQVSRCVAEALRLRVQSIDVRQVASPLDLPSESAPGGHLRLPRGRLLAVCPFESHHDRRLCAPEGSGAADPWVYDPSRPDLRLGDGSAVLPSVAGLAFGGGPYRCPGRYFAEQELGLLVQLFLWSYDMSLSYGDAASRSSTPAAKQAATGTEPAGAEPVQVRAHALEVGPVEPAPRPAAGSSLPAAACKPDSQPQLRTVQGGSLLYAVMALVLGPSAMSWGFGWFDGLDGPMQEWRESGDPAGLLPPCDLRRLVGVKVPRKPCWVQLGRPQRLLAGSRRALM